MSITDSKRTVSVTNLLFCILLAIRIVMTIGTAISNETMERACIYLILILGFALFLSSFLINPHFKLTDIFLFLILLCVLFQYLRTYNSTITSKLFEFFLMITAWRSSRFVNITDVVGKFIVVTEIIHGLILIIISFTDMAYQSFIEYLEVSELLTLGFPNPNQTGIVLFSVISVLMITVRKYINDKGIRGLVYVEIAYLIVLLFRTGSRTSMIGLSILILAILFKMKKRPLNKHPFIVGAITLFQLPSVYIYNYIAEKGYFDGVFFLEKKLISGRQRVYARALENWTDHIFGDINFFAFDNAHNAALTILVNIGIIGFVIYSIYILLEMENLTDICYRGEGIYPMIAILSIFVVGYAESAVLAGGTTYFINFLILIVLAYNYGKKEDVSDTNAISSIHF